MIELRHEIDGKVNIVPHKAIMDGFYFINKSLLPGKMIHPMKLFCTIKLKLDKKEFYG